LHTAWADARQSDSDQLIIDLQHELTAVTAKVLDRLYPGRVPAELNTSDAIRP
jgi:hypothetical protein